MGAGTAIKLKGNYPAQFCNEQRETRLLDQDVTLLAVNLDGTWTTCPVTIHEVQIYGDVHLAVGCLLYEGAKLSVTVTHRRDRDDLLVSFG